MLSQFEDIKEKLRPYLRNLLEDSGVEITHNGMFCCINKMHVDSNPSAKLLSDLDEKQYYCYSCGDSGDIFKAFNQLSDAPVEGHDFIKNNLYKLADKYSVDYTPVEFTPEQLEQIKWYSVYRTISDLLIIKDEEGERVYSHTQFAEERGWDRNICDKLRIGTIIDYEIFIKAIQKTTGFTSDEIKEFDIKRTIFGSDCITISLFDDNNRPIGFTSRWVNWSKGEKRPKYTNTRHTPIFNKSSHLYNLNNAKKSSYTTCDIYEGQGSVIAAMQAGFQSCIALGGTALSDDQVSSLLSHNISSINLVLDPDAAGSKAVSKHLEALSGREGLDVFITEIPKDLNATDPEDIIRYKGIAEFKKLKEISAFEYFLKKDFTNNTDKKKFFEKMIPLILNTSNRIKRGEQIKSLAEITETNEIDIRDEIERLSTESTLAIKRQYEKRLSTARTPDDILSTIDDFRVKIEDSIGSKNEKSLLGPKECADGFLELTTTLNNKKSGLQGWSSGYTVLDNKLSGIPKPIGYDDEGNKIQIAGSIIGIAGAPQHGKSTIIQNLALNLAKNNDDINILYWSLDDSRERTFERMISIDSTTDWRKVTRRLAPSPTEKLKIDGSIKTIHSLIQEGRLNIKDHSTGSTIPMLKRWIEANREHSDKPILVIIDSFHKISGSLSKQYSNDTAMAKDHSQQLKQLAQTHKVTVMCSLEMNKTQSVGSEPSLHHITETRKIEYDFDIIGLVYNKYYDMDGNTTEFTRNPLNNKVMPMIKLNIKKSKDGGAGPVWFSLNTETFNMDCYTTDEMQNIIGREEILPVETNGIKITPPDVGSTKKVENSKSQGTFQALDPNFTL